MNPFAVPTVARNISNSEVQTFLSCRRQYYYSFVLNITPKETGTPLQRGTLFHYAMELYWRARMEGKLHHEAMEIALEAFLHPPSEVTNIAIVMETQALWSRYMNHFQGFPDWIPLGTEGRHDVPLTPDLNLTITYDFYFQEISTGKRFILDYKCTYEFWSWEDHELNGQMSKYIFALQNRGFQVDGGYLEEIRTRVLSAESMKDPKKLYKRTKYLPSKAKKLALIKQHIGTSLEIERFRALPAEDMRASALPVLNKHGACKFCNFKDLCIAELEGKQDLSVDIRVGYVQNTTYGYNGETE